MECPICGMIAKSIDGTYSHDNNGQITDVKNFNPKDREILRAILTALKSPAILPDNVAKLKSVSEAVKKGVMTNDQAVAEISSTSPAFESVFNLAREYGFAIELILALVSIALGLYSLYDSNVTGAQAHSDAVKIEQALERENATLLRLHEALVAQRKDVVQHRKQRLPYKKLTNNPQTQLNASNRQSRRKAASLARKKR